MPAMLELKWMFLPFLACLVLSINHVYLGIHVIARKVIFVDLALAQIAALGATYALTLGYDPFDDSFRVSLFSLAFTFVGAIAFSIARMRKEKVPQEAFIGIIYAAASAAAILILSKSATGGEELKHMLVGDLLLVSWPAVKTMVILYGSIGLFHALFRHKFLAISLDPEAAEASGIKIRFWDVLFYMSFGVVIVKSVAIVGVLLVFSYLVVPAVIAQMWSETVRGKLLTGWLLAILASTLGILWSFHSDYPTGPAIVVTLGIFLVGSGILYYIRQAPLKSRALGNVAVLMLLGVGFFSSLSYFKKENVVSPITQLAPVDQMLKALKQESESSQMDAIAHLGEMRDARIVPALTGLLLYTKSEPMIEALVEALAKQQDPRALPVLRQVDEGNYDDFLKLTIAKAELTLGDIEGFDTLINILKDNEAAFARQQAIELLEARSGRKFGYRSDLPVKENHPALLKIEEWWLQTGRHLQWDAKKKQFHL